jgi:hypothetical protein
MRRDHGDKNVARCAMNEAGRCFGEGLRKESDPEGQIIEVHGQEGRRTNQFGE